ncbi:MAG: hypothetical protein CMP11_04125 [Zetaproteobacteria bacterium]|nr:hypothetical protein [Pseudobdellovibrionaceae bacterium]|tara:strand:- start:1300 stop:1752 length:453 start_codon:yes stop_codon:yes gene_type:complete
MSNQSKSKKTEICLTLLSVGKEVIPTDSNDNEMFRFLSFDEKPTNKIDQFLHKEAKELAENKEKTVHVSGDELFPNYDKKLVKTFPSTRLNKKVTKGSIIQTEFGDEGYVIDVSKEKITADFNNPFSGKPLLIKIKNTGQKNTQLESTAS